MNMAWGSGTSHHKRRSTRPENPRTPQYDLPPYQDFRVHDMTRALQKLKPVCIVGKPAPCNQLPCNAEQGDIGQLVTRSSDGFRKDRQLHARGVYGNETWKLLPPTSLPRASRLARVWPRSVSIAERGKARKLGFTKTWRSDVME